MLSYLQRNISLYTAIALCAALLMWQKGQRFVHPESVIDWDITLYYHYLPATFIYGDLHLEEAPQYFSVHQLYFTDLPGGEKVVKMSTGWAWCNLPAFWIADLWAVLGGFERDGLSHPYGEMIWINLWLWGCLGIFLLRRLFRSHFSEILTAFLTIAVCLGTNYLTYAATIPMPHIYGLVLLVAVVLLVQKLPAHHSLLRYALIGFCCGLLVLLRPTNILLLLWPLGLFLRSLYRAEIAFSWTKSLMLLACVFLPWIPQVLYWQHMAGQWLVYSYGQEGFSFGNPHLIEGLFSYRKGWLVYSPVVALGLIGLSWMATRKHFESRVLFALLALFLYVNFSWWCWWYGGSFGSRATVESLPIIGLGLGWLVHHCKRGWAILWTSAASLMILVSLYLQFLFIYNIVHYDSMTKESYWHLMRFKEIDGDYANKLEAPDYDAAYESGR